MSYTIEPMPIISFLEENKMKLPRFQRRAAWDPTQRFELCISVFQEYPVGVVIVNKEQKISWLLDGRQRRTTLQEMRNNPVKVYEWARSYIKFSKSADELEVTKLYWDKIEKYLQTEEKMEKKINEEEIDVDDYGEDDSNVQDILDEENSFDSKKQRQGLQTLLEIILMVHQNKPSGSKWERLFDFKNYFSKLRYAPTKEGGKVNPELLRRFLLQMDNDCEKDNDGQLTQEYFIEYYVEMSDISEKDLKRFKIDIEKNWKEIEKSIDIIKRSEKIFADARIGIIWLTNATPLDAQNIFSRMNKGGTPLKPEELLSAKPYWNVDVNITDQKVKNLVEKMYLCLDVTKPESIVRWDIAATLITRIDENHLIFSAYESVKQKNDISLDEVTMGFKLISTLYEGGMSGKNVIDLEKNEDINWETDIDELVDDINTICKILLESSFFKYYISWKKPISELLGSAIALEFLAIIYKDWKARKKPTVSSGELKALQRDAIILFDRLVFEYGTKAWRGSGDSKMANDIKDKNWGERIKPIDKNDWKNFLLNVCDGTYNGQNTTVKVLRPVLYYYYCLTDCLPLNEVNTTFDVDHIIPKEKFVGNVMIDIRKRDSLSNLALLPKKDNISKKNKSLNEIKDMWLKTSITTYTGILEEDFDKYSDISNIDLLKLQRQELFITAFDVNRTTKLSN